MILRLSVAVILVTCFSSCNFFKPKTLTFDAAVPNVSSFTIDSTYQLYVREVCRKDDANWYRINGASVMRYPCDSIAQPNVLIERQYLYYSSAYKNAVFIMLIPNYPIYHNGGPRFNQPETRMPAVVNLFNANCFLFGRMDVRSSIIRFKKWDQSNYDEWKVSMDTLKGLIEVVAVKELDGDGKGSFQQVNQHLNINVVYRKTALTYPMNIDERVIDPGSIRNFALEQTFYFSEIKKGKYSIYLPYTQCQKPENSLGRGIKFNGKKGRNSRLPYDMSAMFSYD